MRLDVRSASEDSRQARNDIGTAIDPKRNSPFRETKQNGGSSGTAVCRQESLRLSAAAAREPAETENRRAEERKRAGFRH